MALDAGTRGTLGVFIFTSIVVPLSSRSLRSGCSHAHDVAERVLTYRESDGIIGIDDLVYVVTSRVIWQRGNALVDIFKIEEQIVCTIGELLIAFDFKPGIKTKLFIFFFLVSLASEIFRSINEGFRCTKM